MINFLSLLSPTTIKATAIVVAIGIIAGAGFYLGNKLSQEQARKYEIMALECEKRAKEREIEITQQALEAEKKRLAYEKELTERIEQEIRENGRLSKRLEEEIKKNKVITREVVKYVTLEIQSTVYRECIIPPSGVSVLNKAARDYNSPRDPAGGDNRKN